MSKYSIYDTREELIDSIFKNPKKYLNTYLTKLIKQNSELNNEQTVVSYGFKFRGYCYFNPSLNFSHDKNNLCTLNLALVDKLEQYKKTTETIEQDRKFITTFIASQCFGSKDNGEMFNNLPSIFDSFIKKIVPQWVRESEPEVKDNLKKFYEEIIIPRINQYEAYELLV